MAERRDTFSLTGLVRDVLKRHALIEAVPDAAYGIDQRSEEVDGEDEDVVDEVDIDASQQLSEDLEDRGITIGSGNGRRGLNRGGGGGSKRGLNRGGGGGSKRGLNRGGGGGSKRGLNRGGGGGSKRGLNRGGGGGSKRGLSRPNNGGSKRGLNRPGRGGSN
jgi:hypothetical protein